MKPRWETIGVFFMCELSEQNKILKGSLRSVTFLETLFTVSLDYQKSKKGYESV